MKFAAAVLLCAFAAIHAVNGAPALAGRVTGADSGYGELP